MFRKIYRFLFGTRPPPPKRSYLPERSSGKARLGGAVIHPNPSSLKAKHTATQKRFAGNKVLKGKCHVIDGDTIVINKTHIRIAGIDAPELDHPFGIKSKWAVIHMCKGKVITAKICDEMSYNRVVGVCYLPDGRDIAAELVKQGLAVDWPKYSGGRYSHLEPPDTRKKLWRAAARQKGYFKPD
ncbi:thermonuclease family protein [Sulfitobacter sp. JB4-11]|uniref:thermonuclease family protein n=1 Tax=Sulfitobacter rhodophyticola TaxID=3238304 RepID=UPI0035152EA2